MAPPCPCARQPPNCGRRAATSSPTPTTSPGWAPSCPKPKPRPEMSEPLKQDAGLRIGEILRAFLPGEEIGSWVDGAVLPGKGEALSLTDPATGRAFATFRDADAGT